MSDDNKNGQNNAFDRSSKDDDNNGHHTVYGFGSVAAPGFNPTTGFMWTGTGQPNAGYNTSTDDNVQLSFNVIHRTDGFYTPTGYGANHEANYTVLPGTQTINGGNLNRAEWNVGYEGTSAAGTSVAALAANAAKPAPKGEDGGDDHGDDNHHDGGIVNLNAYDFKMQIVESRPGFIAKDVFDFNSATHVWTGEHSGLAFGGDDFAPGGAPASVQSAVFENSLNVAFLKGDFFGTLPQETAPGTRWDFKEVAFNAGTSHEVAANAVHVLIAPTV